MATKSETPKFLRVQRPHLTREQQALQAQHRPPYPCEYCIKELRRPASEEAAWLMEVPEGSTLNFYCARCGHYAQTSVNLGD